jgi:hypothetical protein
MHFTSHLNLFQTLFFQHGVQITKIFIIFNKIRVGLALILGIRELGLIVEF